MKILLEPVVMMETAVGSENIDIFLNNNFKDAILHPEFFGNRTPLIYIIHKLINPFFGNFEMYRFCGFIFSIFGPIFLSIFKNNLLKLIKKYFFNCINIIFKSLL